MIAFPRPFSFAVRTDSAVRGNDAGRELFRRTKELRSSGSVLAGGDFLSL
ncbi:MAG: hypothetical protein BLITH_0626 [Brockia lithotrophica]|uniref:Uncharacterized protein n=1 Tax=Brockia lithotrophica TaxID=933949 RepID=A0A2T5G8E0_9BACL|nr:MAG: hypothetical protein BLITH_0626 [Brockia lithotrophica]